MSIDPVRKIRELFEDVSTALSKEPVSVAEGIVPKLKLFSKQPDKALHLIIIDYSEDEVAYSTDSTEEIEVFNYRIICEHVYWKYATKEIAKFPRTSIVAAVIESTFPLDKLERHFIAFCREIPLILISTAIKEAIGSLKKSLPSAYEIISVESTEINTLQVQPAITKHLNEKQLEIIYHKSLMLLLGDLLNVWRSKKQIVAAQVESQQQQLQLKIHQLKTATQQHIKQEFNELLNDLTKEASVFEKKVQKKWERYIDFSTAPLWADLRGRILAIEELDELKKRGALSFKVYEHDKKAVINALGQTLNSNCSSDSRDINELMEYFNDELVSLFKKHNVPLVEIRSSPVHSDDYQEIISRSCVFRKSFEGEMKTKGFMQYFYAVRQYQMLIFMILGGGSLGLAKMGNNKDWLFPVGFFFIGLAMFQVVIKTRKDNQEHKEKELKKAQEWIKTEVKGMLQLFWREWKLIRSEILSNQFADLSIHYERELQKYLDQENAARGSQEGIFRTKIKKNENLSRQLKTANTLGYQFDGKYKGTNDMLASLFKTS